MKIHGKCLAESSTQIRVNTTDFVFIIVIYRVDKLKLQKDNAAGDKKNSDFEI